MKTKNIVKAIATMICLIGIIGLSSNTIAAKKTTHSGVAPFTPEVQFLPGANAEMTSLLQHLLS